MLSKTDPLAMALAGMAVGIVKSCDESTTATDDEEDNMYACSLMIQRAPADLHRLTPTASRDPYARPYDTYSTTTATDEGGVE